MHQSQINSTISFVKRTLASAEGGHDWWHIHRVLQNAKLILQTEQGNAFVVELAVLLHDIADSKFNNGDEEEGPAKAAAFLQTIKVDETDIIHIRQIITHMSYRSGLEKNAFTSPEMKIVQDADRLDAIGAIGIARAFNYGGFKNRSIYDPGIEPLLQMTKEQYKNSTAPTINHFYEKLLSLKDLMNTEAGRRIAEDRHAFMLNYLEQFKAEWEGER